MKNIQKTFIVTILTVVGILAINLVDVHYNLAATMHIAWGAAAYWVNAIFAAWSIVSIISALFTAGISWGIAQSVKALVARFGKTAAIRW